MSGPIVLTDAPPVPKKLTTCPKHPKAAIVPANMAQTHGICSQCGYEPLELPA